MLCTLQLVSRCAHWTWTVAKFSKILVWVVQVEQERFVIQPFSMLDGKRSTDDVDSAADDLVPEERKATASPR